MQVGGAELLMHSLDHIEHYTKAWIDHLQEPTESGVSRCPYAKKATHRHRKVYDYHSAYDYWEAVSDECDKFDGSVDVVLVAAATNNQHIDDQILGGGVDAINTFLNKKAQGLWLVFKYDHVFTIIMIQKISFLDDASRVLETKGYYNRYNKQQMEKVVHGRRRYREKLDGV